MPSLDAEVLASVVGLPPDFPVEPGTFFSCVDCYPTALALLEPVDTNGLTDALEEQVIDPLAEADLLVDPSDRVTRLVTVLSPNEMNYDPMFRVQPGLLPVPRSQSEVSTQNCGTTPGSSRYAAAGSAFAMPTQPYLQAQQLPEWPHELGLQYIPNAVWAAHDHSTTPATTTVDNEAVLQEGIDVLLADELVWLAGGDTDTDTDTGAGTDTDLEETGKCGCASATSAFGWVVLAPLMLLRRRGR